MSPKKCTTIYLTVASESYPISVDNTDAKLFMIRSPMETTKPYSQLASDTSYSSSYNSRTSSISELSPSAALTYDLT